MSRAGGKRFFARILSCASALAIVIAGIVVPLGLTSAVRASAGGPAPTPAAVSSAYSYDARAASTIPAANLRDVIRVARPAPAGASPASTSLIALRVAAKAGTTIYRAVGPAELADLRTLGRYLVPRGGAEGKYFFDTPEQASNFARMMGDKPYTTTSVRVSLSQLGKGDRINPVREGPGYFFRTPDVPSGPVTILDRSVLP